MIRKKNQNEAEAGQVITIQKAEVVEAVEVESQGQELVVPNAGGGELVEQPSRGAVVVRMMSAMMSGYHPKPMVRPVIDPDFEELTVVPRVAEVCRISAARLLYAVSPEGGLQAWWKMCLAWLGGAISAVLVLSAIAVCLTYFLGHVELASLALQKIAVNLVIGALVVVAGTAIFALVNILIHGAWTLSKSKIMCAIITLVVIIALLVVGLAFGLEWLDSRFSGTFESVRGWAEFFRLVPKK